MFYSSLSLIYFISGMHHKAALIFFFFICLSVRGKILPVRVEWSAVYALQPTNWRSGVVPA